MQTIGINRYCAVRFRRWSRNGYAAFMSLHREVTIGVLTKGVCEKSLSKQCGFECSIVNDKVNLVEWELSEMENEFLDAELCPAISELNDNVPALYGVGEIKIFFY